MVQPYKPLYTVLEVADILLSNTDVVYSEIRAGQLPALKLGRMKIRGSDLEQYIENLPAMKKEEATETA